MTLFRDYARLQASIRYDFVEVEDGELAKTMVVDLRTNDYGLWQVVYPFGTRVADMFIDAYVSGIDLGRLGMVFRLPDTGEVIASGPLTTMIASDGRRNGVAENAVSAWGVTDLTHLRERICFPVPTVDIPVSNGTTTHSWTAFTRNKTAPAETMILDYINENLGAGAVARRRLGASLAQPPTLVLPTSLGRGGTFTYKAPANRNVLDAAQEIAKLSKRNGPGLTFDLRQGGPSELVFTIREPEVRDGIVWSVEAGTAEGVAIKSQRRPKTSVINGGYGDDATVEYVRRDEPAPPGGYSEVREEFMRGNGDDAEQMVQEAEEELIEDGPELGLDITPAPDLPWQVGRDYELGDLFVGVFEGLPFTTPVNRALLRHEEGTLVEEVETGFDESDDLEPTFNLLRRQLERLRRRSR